MTDYCPPAPPGPWKSLFSSAKTVIHRPWQTNSMDISQGKSLRSKKPGISQRLNRALGLMVILLVASAGLLLWIVQVRSQAMEQKLSLGGGTDRLGYHLTQMSDSVRGVLLDPKS